MPSISRCWASKYSPIIGADPTAHLLQRVLDKLFWLALIALILGAVCFLIIALVPPYSPPRSSEGTSGSSENHPASLNVTGQWMTEVITRPDRANDQFTRSFVF